MIKKQKINLLFLMLTVSLKSSCMYNSDYFNPEYDNEPFAPQCIGQDIREEHPTFQNTSLILKLINTPENPIPQKSSYYSKLQPLKRSNLLPPMRVTSLLTSPTNNNTSTQQSFSLSSLEKKSSQPIIKKRKYNNKTNFAFECTRCFLNYKYYNICVRHVNKVHLKILAHSCSGCCKKFLTPHLVNKHIQRQPLCIEAQCITNTKVMAWVKKLAPQFVAEKTSS